jgi:hypothetical protein
MKRHLGIITGITVVLAVCVVLVGFFGLLVALNGYDGDTGGRILLGFLVVAVLSLVLTGWGTYRLIDSIRERTNWSLWLIGPLSMVIALVGFTACLILAGGFLIVLLG